LYYEVRRKTGPQTALSNIQELITTRYKGQSGIIYTISRKSAEKIASDLLKGGIAARHYHAQIEPHEKVQVQKSWQQGQVKVVVATIAFGMGIDKPDVRFVIHYGLPKSLEGYYQETGRAGRDGNQSDCILYFNFKDVSILRRMIQDGEGSPEQIERQMSMLNRVASFCDNQSECRRVEILRYFGEKFSKDQCNKSCDNCRNGGDFAKQDFSTYAVAALHVVRSQNQVTVSRCCDYLLGKKQTCDGDGHPENRNFGIARNKLKKFQLECILDKLSAEGALCEESKFYRKNAIAVQYLKVGGVAPCSHLSALLSL
jgi:bloom syndrome protein